MDDLTTYTEYWGWHATSVTYVETPPGNLYPYRFTVSSPGCYPYTGTAPDGPTALAICRRYVMRRLVICQRMGIDTSGSECHVGGHNGMDLPFWCTRPSSQ